MWLGIVFWWGTSNMDADRELPPIVWSRQFCTCNAKQLKDTNLQHCTHYIAVQCFTSFLYCFSCSAFSSASLHLFSILSIAADRLRLVSSKSDYPSKAPLLPLFCILAAYVKLNYDFIASPIIYLALYILNLLCAIFDTPLDWHTHMGVSIITLRHSLYHKSLLTHPL